MDTKHQSIRVQRVTLCVLTSLVQQASCSPRPKKCWSVVTFTSPPLWFINPSPAYSPIHEWGICDLLFHVLMRRERVAATFLASLKNGQRFIMERDHSLLLHVMCYSSSLLRWHSWRCDTYLSCIFWSLTAYWLITYSSNIHCITHDVEEGLD